MADMSGLQFCMWWQPCQCDIYCQPVTYQYKICHSASASATSAMMARECKEVSVILIILVLLQYHIFRFRVQTYELNKN